MVQHDRSDTSDSLLALVVSAYIDDLRSRQFAPSTIAAREHQLNKYREWCESRGVVELEEQTPEVVMAYLLTLQESGLANSTLRKYHSMQRVFFKWVTEWELLPSSPMERFGTVRVPTVQAEPFSLAELAAIEQALHTRWNGELGLRNRAIVAVLLDTGLRRAELCGLDVEDMDWMSGELRVRMTKDSRPRSVVLGASARNVVRRYWLKVRRQRGESGPLFLTAQGKRMHVSTLNAMMVELGEAAGIERAHPHRYRHTCGVLAVRAGMLLFQLQQMLGYRDMTMIQRYADLAETDLYATMRAHSPLEHLKLKL